ncbi:aspartate/glutamate racemase family protein [Phaeovulum sp. W22_SRMD_FR3]|uniref:aspartate/glutamate racemase family protein n=1 Tax=Phaeovulum sp. W22_SRMD_FR3 TaxID=3240274 RepID=UPI003F95CBEA
MSGTSERKSIGIIAGSGPEAGVDLWSKVIRANQAAFGPAYRGDLDAPRVVVVSEPRLGLSMDLAAHEEAVWETLRTTILALAPQVDCYAIACNTLNWYAPRIEALGLAAEFVSFPKVIRAALRARGLTRVALLGAAPVQSLGPWSVYRDLTADFTVETPAGTGPVHSLIEDIKRLGSEATELRPRLAHILSELQEPTVLLACTELPLIATMATDKQLLDVTDLVAEALVNRALPQDMQKQD